jgi:uncharacterized protein (UPF0335 family)
VETSETYDECKKHIQHRIVDIFADIIAIAFFVKLIYDIAREEPYSEIDP